MENKKEEALNYFRSGFNCSQSVLLAYTKQLNIDENLSKSIACGFGGGMGRLQETCGAVTGSYMVLSVFNSQKHKENNDKKEESYSMIQNFSKKFESIHKTTNCKELLKCEINSIEGRMYAKEHKLFDTICEKCICDSINIIEELIK